MTDEEGKVFTAEEFETRRYRRDLREKVDHFEGDLRAMWDEMAGLRKEIRELRSTINSLIDSETHGMNVRNRDAKSAFVALMVTLATVLADKFF